MSYEEKKFLEQKRIALPLAQHLQFFGVLLGAIGVGFSIMAVVDRDMPIRHRNACHSVALFGALFFGSGYYMRRYYQKLC